MTDDPGPSPSGGEPAALRRDAAANCAAPLDAAAGLIYRNGVSGTSTDLVAREAGVGKGTLVRRFGDRAGLMAALLDRTGAQWQERVIHGPSPLGPGGAPLDRLKAFGASCLAVHLQFADLILAAGGGHAEHGRGMRAFQVAHVRYLLAELGLHGDLDQFAAALVAPLEVSAVAHQVRTEGLRFARVSLAGVDLVRRVVRP